MMTYNDVDLVLLETMMSELAQHDADHALDRPPTAEDRAAIARLDASARAQLQRLRKEAFTEIQRATPPAEPRSLPARIVAMAREAVLARLRELELQSPVEFQAAYRKLESLSVDDLRVALADLEEALGIAEAP
jgi:hypothetical protein